MALFTQMNDLFADPMITSINPRFGSTSGGEVVSVTGKGFTGTTSVTVGNVPATFIVNSDTSLSVITPASTPIAANIEVTAPTGISSSSNYSLFTYQGSWTAYVPNSGSANITPINLTTQPLTNVSSPGSIPGQAAITPDGKFTYVTSGTSGVIVINNVTNSIVTNIPMTGFPQGIAITPDGKKAYVTRKITGQVSIIDIATNAVIGGPITVGLNPMGIAITPDGKKAYVVNSISNDLTVINLLTNSVLISSLSVGISPQFVTITPNGKTAYVTNSDSSSSDPPSVSIINTATDTVGITPITLPSHSAPWAIAATPDGQSLYVTLSNLNAVSHIDVLSNSVVGSPISVGSLPQGIAITPDSRTVLVSNANSNNVIRIDTSNDKVIGSSIAVGSSPQQLEITPDQAPVAFFTIATSNTLSVIFDASLSASPVGSIASYEWDFGDGQSLVTGSPVTTHTYAISGAFNVTLKVTNSAGTSTRKTFTGINSKQQGDSSALFTQAFTLAPAAPLSFTVEKLKNKFPNKTLFINRLKWTPSLDPAIIGYLILRDGVQIGLIPSAGPFILDDPNVKKNQQIVYTLVAFDRNGSQSLPISIVVSR